MEIRARDEDYNVEATPAKLTFTVIPPVWQQSWFAGLLIILLSTGLGQTARLIRRDRHLAAANLQLEHARIDLENRVKQRTQELSAANEQLIQEVAERERTERELIHLERLRAVGEMSAGISHNLNNILTGILGPAQVVRAGLTDSDSMFYLDTVIKSAERAAELVRRLHKAVRGERSESCKPIAVNKTILDAIETARPRWKDEPESKGIRVEMLTESHTSGKAGGLKVVNRSKRLETMCHLKVASSERYSAVRDGGLRFPGS
jgi:C4-dicarboxylate-specific signal transduction histidine kinase